MEKNLAFRKTHQPSLVLPNCGSVFKNPDGNSAGKLLDEVGAKSYSCGGAKVWENHANFIINNDHASSSSVEQLIDTARYEVFNKFGKFLETEVKILR
jgi:UDP-N-acetylmuramate dehydrogenase